jgi:hypothetical protein
MVTAAASAASNSSTDREQADARPRTWESTPNRGKLTPNTLAFGARIATRRDAAGIPRMENPDIFSVPSAALQRGTGDPMNDVTPMRTLDPVTQPISPARFAHFVSRTGQMVSDGPAATKPARQCPISYASRRCPQARPRGTCWRATDRCSIVSPDRPVGARSRRRSDPAGRVSDTCQIDEHRALD